MSDNFKILDWDTNFFGFTVACIEQNFLKEGKDSGILQQLLDKDVMLSYYFSDSPLDTENFSEDFDVLLVDEKVPLIKRLNSKAVTHPKISLYDRDTAEDKLIQLAIRAGEQSRFKSDPNIPEGKFEELFKIWIEKSVEKEIATDVLVYKENSEIVGFITVQVKDGKPYASLMAVQNEYEGKGVAFALMNAVEDILTSRGYLDVFSSTQANNRKALLIYSRHGMELLDPVYVYHIWNKKNSGSHR